MVDRDQFFDFNDSRKPVEKLPRSNKGKGRSFDSVVIVKQEADVWRLFTVSFGREQPAGGRLLKKEPWPIDRFTFSNKEEANDAAEALAKYLGTKFINDTKYN